MDGEPWLDKLIDAVFSEAGAVGFLLLVANIVLYRLFSQERLRSAEHHKEVLELSVRTIEAIGKLTTAVEIMNKRSK